jgi:phage terminase large subunit
VSIVLDYAPRRHFLSFHGRRERWAILVCHRRAGKTVATLNDLIKAALTERKREGRYGFVFPQRNQAKDTAWAYLKRFAGPVLAKPPNESDLRVDLVSGSMVRLYGNDNPDAMRGPYFDGVVLDEYAQMAPSTWIEVIRPMLSDRHGWAIFIGTPKGKNAFWELWSKAQKNSAWFTMMLKASESGLLAQSELDDALDDMGPDMYAQEFECSFEAAIKGAFYAEEMRAMAAEGRLAPIRIDKAVRVQTAWDLGVSDSSAIWFIQAVGRERRLVDYYESSGVGLEHYAQVLFDKRMLHGWTYGEHFFPHDIAHRELSSGASRLDSLRKLGIEATIVPQSSVLDGINATRKMLKRTWIDPERCFRGLEALRQYRREWDKHLNDWKSSPLHDWSSHGSDALRCFATGFDEPKAVQPSRHRVPERPSGATHWSA